MSNIQMRDVWLSIIATDNYLEGYDKMLQKEYNQNFGFQAILTQFPTKSG